MDLGIVDTHLHLWDPNHLRYPWLDLVPLLNKQYLLPEYRAAHSSVPVEKMVFVECEADPRHAVDEANWVASLIPQDPRIEGIVPSAPLEKGEAATDVLDQLAEIPQVRGIRRNIQMEPDVAFCLRPDFVKGVQILSRYNYSFDICIGHINLANTLGLVRQCPGVLFILDHIGKPNIKEHVLEPWKSELRELAALENVFCKVSGLVVEADLERWTQKDLKPYLDHVFECFGFDRVMFGGDWPVVLQATELTEWIETLERAVADCSDTERRKLFRENAIRFYRLD